MLDINQIIRERRSIYPKEFTGKILDSSIIQTLLENANFAPNHLSNYPWRFVVIEADALQNFLDKAADIYKEETPIEKFKQEKLDKFTMYKEQISHIIAIVLHREPDGKSVEIEDISAVACAVQNMYLSLSQFEEAGGYWSTGMGTYSKSMSTFLRLESNDTLMGYFVLGHVFNKRKSSNRKNVEHFTRYL